MPDVEVWRIGGWDSPREDNGFQSLPSSQKVLSRRIVEPHHPWRTREEWQAWGSRQGKARDLGYSFQPLPPSGPRSLHP